MIPLEHLRWATPALRALANIRILADGTTTLAVLDLIQRSVPDEYKSPEPQWLYTYTTHLIQRPGHTDRFQMPAVGLTDGPDHIIVQVGIPDAAAWERLRGKVLPRFQEGERTIDFPPLPDHPLW